MATINIFGVVGEDVRAADIIPKIQAEKGDVIEVGIMSIGGDVREGLAIYDALREASANGQEVKTFALGITASIASIIFMAGDVREVSDNAEIMIHNSSVVMGGNKHDLKGAIEVLDDIDSKMIGIYESRTGLDKEVLAELLNEETFMSADDAVSKGFATDKTNVLAIVAIINKTKKEPVKMATKEEDKQAGFLAHMAKWFKGEVKAEHEDEEKKEDEDAKAEGDDEEKKEPEEAAFGDDEKKEDDEEAKAEGDDDKEKEEMKAKIESLQAELDATKAKAEGDDEEKKDEEAKASLILSAITDKKVTMHTATKLFKKSLSDVSASLGDLESNATKRGKTEEPNADASNKHDQWKAMKDESNHGAAQKFYNKHSTEIRSEMSKDK